jgi:hypothetical protein
MRRHLGIALVGAAALCCGGKSTECPAGYVCTPIGDGGGTSGATSVASQIQLTPSNLASDGTTLFWTSSVGNGGDLSSMPVGGGAVSAVVHGPVSGGFLVVDDTNVYFPDSSGGIARAPKGGGGASALVTEQGAILRGFTSLGATAYWIEGGGGPMQGPVSIKSAPLKGGAPSDVAQYTPMFGAPGLDIGVTTTTVFLSGFGAQGLTAFSLATGIPDGGAPASIPGFMQGCQVLVSDTAAVYCSTGGSLIRVASDGTQTMLGTVLGGNSGAFALDDTDVYWVDNATVGTIMKVPKTGGTASIVARDTNPVAIAVDAHAVYWSDQGGSIMRLPK